MVKKISRKAPLFMAACLAFALVLAGCGGTSSPAGPGLGGGGGTVNGGGDNGQQQPPANKFTFGGVPRQLNAALFYDGAEGFNFLLSTAATPDRYTMNILFSIPSQLMGYPISLHKGYNPDYPAWSWAIGFVDDQNLLFSYSGRWAAQLPDEEGTMQVTLTNVSRFKIEVEGTLGGEPFSLHFYDDFTYSTHDVWDIGLPVD